MKSHSVPLRRGAARSNLTTQEPKGHQPGHQTAGARTSLCGLERAGWLVRVAGRLKNRSRSHRGRLSMQHAAFRGAAPRLSRPSLKRTAQKEMSAFASCRSAIPRRGCFALKGMGRPSGMNRSEEAALVGLAALHPVVEKLRSLLAVAMVVELRARHRQPVARNRHRTRVPTPRLLENASPPRTRTGVLPSRPTTPRRRLADGSTLGRRHAPPVGFVAWLPPGNTSIVPPADECRCAAGTRRTAP
jgi:hypothetical protein